MSDKSPSIKERSIRGFRWEFINTASIVTMQLSFGIVLARLLRPEDFGPYVFSMIFVGFVSIYSSAGISQAIIQNQNITDEHLRVGFTLSLLIGLLATTTLWIIAPFFTKNNQTPILRIVSFSFVLSAVGSIAGALLQKQLNFKNLCWVEIVSYGIGQGIISIALAVMGFGVWALVIGILSYYFIKSLALMIVSPHSKLFLIKRNIVKELMHFGVGMSLGRLANYAAQNSDYFVIGRILQSEALGLYSRAFQVVRSPTGYIASMLNNILFPAYAVVQKDNQRIKNGFFLSVSLVSFVTFPLMVWLMFAAPKLIKTVYGIAWVGSVSSVQILCISGAFGSIYTLSDTLAKSVGKVYPLFVRQLIYAVLVITGALIGVKSGIQGVSLAVSFATLVMYIITYQFTKQIIMGTWINLLKAQIPGVIVGLFVAIFCSLTLYLGDLYAFTDILVLLGLSISFVLSYSFVILILPVSCLAEIPTFLVSNCYAVLPTVLFDFLSSRTK